MNVITLTLNPAYDVHCEAETFEARRENIAAVTQRMAGGKGVNISRALQAADVPNTALAVLGQENAAEFREELQKCGVRLSEIPVPGRIRENITLHVPGESETRLSFRGFAADDALLDPVRRTLDELAKPGDVVTMTGRIPDGVTLERVKALLMSLQDRGVRCVIDSKSFRLSDLLDCRPFLIKPNEEEIADYLGRPADSFAAVMQEAGKLHQAGIENVMVSMGAQGAMLVSSEGVFTAVPPAICPVSTVGAGDSAIAGFLAAVQAGKASAERLRTAVAFGTAACLTEGTNPPRREEITRILPLILVSQKEI